MQIPSFPECNHPLVQTLHHHSDRELLTLFQRHPESGKYFTAIFCRYSPIVYSLIQHSVRSPAQANYLFAVTWRHLYYELGGLDLNGKLVQSPTFSLQSWLIQITALCINRVALPAVEEINYSLPAASPPFWCFVEQALDRLTPRQRFIILMAQTFHWSEPRISAYLQAEGEVISSQEVQQELADSYQQLELALPEDICAIYLNRSMPDPLSNNRDELESIFRLDPIEPVFESH
ncbi:MAG: RNA polymerase sigma factor [Leptolyngbya sp. IPPAS B-1204]|uniref:Sigma-70 family RNA polymerase sigma factor n=1 Tax=Leptolyngbya sp. NK1-12 TaxID=2547451 RepID=A0AA96WDH7_9CYAN|nr:sigma-70 family RNA polymerase sigma factor [Leptolyngbya sp. NK1-12]MBF2051168.1 sigma-70 family RNA polymerase sigma factor [Elainella sp. C42_A2020_010]RNJ66059.1 MAG: sigma-70 family RNA polymerase sigma factor [Leptolyngbya sp. IPPAS B-1204]WNZ22960.1 sigma-70 family RNA polymerase sigma factor [Leptolyngbya sp. NK1-12]